MVRMQLILVFALAALLGAAMARPDNQEPMSDAVPAVALSDVADVGGQHAEEGERPARWLWGGWGGGWGGGWNGGWGGGWRVSYRPWGYGYRSYWW
ncbi:uncharacterized protein F12A10.7 [Drosophila persimilis]|nr:uncharacterized protein F12A10.7 [Drosophila persimilis]